MATSARTLLLTGATGFVGGAVRPALARAGWHVRCLTRNAARARAPRARARLGRGRRRGSGLVRARARRLQRGALPRARNRRGRRLSRARARGRLDLRAGGGARRASAGSCTSAASRRGGRGGSEHLRSRLDVGEALRAGPVQTIELRASMIVGYGSLSWLIVRDLAARLPVMVLPRWLKSRTQPVAIDDVVIALVRRARPAADRRARGSTCPDRSRCRGRRSSRRPRVSWGFAHPRMIEVPLLSPRLSSLWVRFVTRAQVVGGARGGGRPDRGSPRRATTGSGASSTTRTG